MICGLLIILILLYLVLWNSKVKFLKMREASKPITAKVIQYRNEKGPMRNDYTPLPYPYVSINDNTSELRKLKYASSNSKPFKINDEIIVFWFSGTLYYWDAFDRGVYKYLPGQIKF
jgi:hypothetical protein